MREIDRFARQVIVGCETRVAATACTVLQKMVSFKFV